MLIPDSEQARPALIDRDSAEREVTAMVDGAGLKVQALKNDLVITNPLNPERGLVCVDLATGLVTLERPAWDFWGVLEGYQAEDPAEDEPAVSMDKIVAALTDRARG